ncbi:prepilin peptidase [Staphylococcus warneri]|uniref:prepilin peptidase n=1 Tax=Staphylococcus warneri TaxID=1292 RepID=UPI00066C6BD8|nr:A24 family peptidase [Staphylococcus warneri]MBY6178530.1 prepilin peptidase [Staphylococcaceae bacterium DP2N0-1]RQM95973.1 prepilin peptidase [Staphylococcus warneri]
MLIYTYVSSILFSFLYQLSANDHFDKRYLKLRSKCDYCKSKLKYYDFIPIFSFLILKGKSRCCKQPLKYSYLIGELLAILPILLIYYQLININPQFYLTTFLFLLVMSINDIEDYCISLIFLMIFTTVLLFTTPIFLNTFLLTFIISHLFFILMYRYIGYGDILLFNILSLFLPINFMFYLFLFTFMIGGILSIIIKIFFNHNIKYVPLILFIFLSFVFVSSFYPSLTEIMGGVPF